MREMPDPGVLEVASHALRITPDHSDPPASSGQSGGHVRDVPLDTGKLTCGDDVDDVRSGTSHGAQGSERSRSARAQ